MTTEDNGLLALACTRIRALKVPAYVKDSELRYVAVNDAYARFFGLTVEDFIGQTFGDLSDRPEDEACEERERRTLVFGEEESALCFDPFSPARYRVRLERFETDDGSVFVFGMFDETEVQRASGALSMPAPRRSDQNGMSDELCRAILQNAPNGVYVRDASHTTIFVNDSYLALRGLKAVDVLGKVEVETFGALGEQYYDNNQRLLDTGEPVQAYDTVVHEDGTAVPILSRTMRVETDNGERYIVGSVNDVSQQMAREAELEAARQEAEGLHLHLETLLRALPVGILIVDPDFVIEYANDAFYDVWKVDPPFDINGWTYRQFLEYGVQLGAQNLEYESVDELYSRRVEQLLANDSRSAWELVSPNGDVFAVNSKRLETGKYLIAYSKITALRQRELETSLYRSALEQMQVPVFLRDDGGRLVFMNAAYEQILGGKREQFLGKTEREMFPEIGEDLRQQNETVLRDNVAIEKHEVLTLDGGRTIPVITRVERIETVDRHHYLVGSITDVSALKTRETQLIEAQGQAERFSAYLNGILRSMPVGVLILGKDRTIEFANAKVAEIWEWPVTESLEGHSFLEFEQVRHEQGWTWWSELDFSAEAGQRLEELRVVEDTPHQELKASDGKMVVVTCQAIIDGRALITYSDITDVRQREQEISEARARLAELGQVMRDATRVMSQGLLVIEGDQIKLANEALPEILDLPAHLVSQGQPWRACFDYCADRGDFGDHPEEFFRGWKADGDDIKPFSVVFLADRKTWVQMEATVSGRGRWTIACTDITEIKQREQELTELLLRAETADRAKSEFLANMSHEIRTPMNGVLGMAELLSKSALDTRQKTFVDIIVKSGNALLTIINDILDFSKIDAGQLSLRKAPFDPVEAIEDVATLLSTSAAEKDIELIVRGDATMRHMVVGDAGRFRQIVTNLVGNAVKFTEKGHVLIELSSEPAEPGHVMTAIRIEDTGIGIPPSKRDAIFDKFSQVDASSTRRHEGTGLGLAITAGLVDLFGGRIEVESEVGRGSVFTVYLPFVIAKDRQRLNPVPFNVQDARILVIDDNAINRRILTEQLANWGFDGVAVENGRYALAILDEAARTGIAIDALVVDYQMPGMNGIDVARLIRGDRRFDDIAIIFLTSMDMVGDERIFRELNVQAHLMKPARAYMLRAAIVDVVRASRIKRGSTPRPKEPVVELPEITIREQQKPGSVALKSHPAVLVAEDNEVNQIVFTQILHGMGLEFVIVANGAAAVESYKRLDPGVIIMDVSMPVMNGHEATRAIRALEAEAGDGRHVPIIGVTAHALESDRELCLAAGMDDYMSKPISPELLQQKIDRWILAGPGRQSGAG